MQPKTTSKRRLFMVVLLVGALLLQFAAVTSARPSGAIPAEVYNDDGPPLAAALAAGPSSAASRSASLRAGGLGLDFAGAPSTSQAVAPLNSAGSAAVPAPPASDGDIMAMLPNGTADGNPGRRLLLCSSISKPSLQCQTCLCQGLMCLNYAQTTDSCFIAKTCGTNGIVENGRCIGSCPDTFPYYECGADPNHACHRCPASHPNFWEGRCYRCYSGYYWNPRDGKCYPNPEGEGEEVDTSSGDTCGTRASVAYTCDAPRLYNARPDSVFEDTPDAKCSNLRFHGTLEFVNYGFKGQVLSTSTTANWAACKGKCDASYPIDGCIAWAYNYIAAEGKPAGTCQLLSSVQSQQVVKGLVSGYTAHNGLDLFGKDYKKLTGVADAKTCQGECVKDKAGGCQAWTYIGVGNTVGQPPQTCWLKTQQPAFSEKPNLTSGTVQRAFLN